MRRTVIVATCCVALALAILAVWLVARRGGPEVVQVPPDTGDSAQPDTKPPTIAEKVVYDLPVRVAFFGDDEFGPGYVDLETKTFHHWKGVVLTREQLMVTAYGRISGRIGVLDTKDFTVATVEAPVKYLDIGGQFRPGYQDRTINAFYQWKGIVLSKEELLDKCADGKNSIIHRTGYLLGSPQVIEIEVPAHLKDQLAIWKKA